MKSSNILVILTILSTCYFIICLAQNSPEDYLDAHNKARAEVGVPPLCWDETLEAYAKNYSESKIESCEMVHSGGPYGENLAEGSDPEMTATDAVNFWLDEKKYYDNATNSCVQDECRHYTQVVWHDTLHLGCAKAHCTKGWTFIICSYDPPGNYVGDHPY
jgi:pathogenesis-related protein 1